MMARLPVPILHRVFPVAGHRLVVVDAGTRTLKLLVAETSLGRFRILHRQSLELEDDSPDAPADVPAQLAAALPALGPYELVLVLPQHRTISTILDVPPEAAAETEPFIEAEARKLSGLSEETMFHGHVRLHPFGRFRNPHFVTLCKRAEIRAFIERFAPAADEASESGGDAHLTEIVTTGQAMFAALQGSSPAPHHAVLVDLGAENTVVGIMVNGQGVHATSFEGGGNQFTAAIRIDRDCTLPTAELLKRTENLLTGAARASACARAIEKWYGELQRAVAEWIDDYPELGLDWPSLPVYLCGGGASQPGLVGYLNGLGPLKFHPWPAAHELDPDLSMDQYRVAHGAARTALGRAGKVISLLPPEVALVCRRRRWWERVQAANVILLLVLALILGLATRQKLALLHEKDRLIGQTRAALLSAEAVVQLAHRLENGYAGLRPVLLRQQQSLETLAALAAVRRMRTNQDYWLVLFADAASYAAGTTLSGAATNPPGSVPVPPATNAPAPRREFIGELCIPQEGDAARNILSQAVGELKKNPVFGRVDALPTERKRTVVDPRVAISNRVFAVSMEVGPTEISGALDALSRLGLARDPRRAALAPGPVRPRTERGRGATNMGDR